MKELSCFLAELLGTAILILLGNGVVANVKLERSGMQNGNSAHFNPARDLGPRLMYALLPLGKKNSANWGYAWVPVVAPFLGALAAVGLYKVFPWPQI